MIAGENRNITWIETQAAVFTVNAPLLVVTNPDGSDQTPDVTDTPSGSALTHTLSALVDFSQAGRYELAWSWEEGSETFIRPDMQMAYWSDIPALVRQLMQRGSGIVPDSLVAEAASTVLDSLLVSFPCLVSYNAVTGTDKRYLDRALGYLVAALLRPAVIVQSAAGPIVRRKQGPVETQYADLSKALTVQQSLDQQWQTEAARALVGVACIAAAFAATPFNIFDVSGPSRTARGRGRIEDILSTILTNLYDDFWTWGVNTGNGGLSGL
jgi:hypothetical protein